MVVEGREAKKNASKKELKKAEQISIQISGTLHTLGLF